MEYEEIEELRNAIKDYYESAAIVMDFGALFFESAKVDQMSDEEVIEEAQKLHLLKK